MNAPVTSTSVPSRIENLQALRAFAALAVVYYHVTSEAGLNLAVNIGAHGVDVFFVISGFIISHVAAHDSERFFVKRLIRVVPFYWTATIGLYLLAALVPNLLRSTRADPAQLVASLLFIPRETAYAGVVPTLVLGWSLNYEMYFYILFAAALRISRRSAPLVCTAALTVIAFAIDVADPTSATVRFYARPLVFEFALGILAYYVFRASEANVGKLGRRLPQVYVWVAGVLSLIALGVEEYMHSFGLPRLVAAGVPAFCLVTSALLLERVYGQAIRLRAVNLLGEASYILYLVHPYIIYGLLRAVLRGHVATSPAAHAAVIVLLLSVSSCVAIGLHVWFERPVLAFLRRQLAHGSAQFIEVRVPVGHPPVAEWRQ